MLNADQRNRRIYELPPRPHFILRANISPAEIVGSLRDSYPFTGSAYTPDDLGITEVRIGETVLTTDSYSFAFDNKTAMA